MMRIRSASRKVVVSTICFVIVVGAGCRPAGTRRFPPEEKCRRFKITKNVPITIVGGQQKTIPLGGENFLTVPSGALPPGETREYRGNPVGFSIFREAGLKIESAEGISSTPFAERLTLQLKYAGCPFETKTDEFVVVKTDNAGNKSLIEGEKDATAKTFTVKIDSFSKFAIAIN